MNRLSQRSKNINTIKHKYRQLTASFRMLPQVQIVGVQKGGTSSLYNYLIQHPEVYASLKKEMHYFTGGINPEINTYKKSTLWYKAHFPIKALAKNKLAIDATPMHLYHPLCAQRIYNLLPESKIIILLRDPVERAISHYFHSQRHGFEHLPIEQAFSEEENRLKQIILNKDYKHSDFRTKSYLHRGLYLEQIKRYQQLFPEKNILIMSSEELFANTQTTLQKVYSFLNIDENFVCPNIKGQNLGSNKKAVSETTRQWLKSYFKPHNKALFEHLNVNYSWNS